MNYGCSTRWTGRVMSVALAALLLVAATACGSAQTSGPNEPTDAGATAPPSSAAGTVPAGSEAAARPARPSPGCGTSTATAADGQARTMTVAGEERQYFLTVPPQHDGKTPVPLLLDFHGLGEGAQLHMSMSNFGAVAKEEGFVVAFPHGQGTPVRWDTRFPPAENHDLEFVDRLLEKLGQELCLDESRVYSTGLSYGAIMTSFLACARTDKFAAVAPVAGIQLLDCTPSRPLPVITFHGTDDPILLFNGGFGSIPGLSADSGPTTTAKPADLNGAGYPATVAQWAKNNGCDPTPTDTTISPEVLHRVYRCPAGQDVEFYILTGGGHAWPGSETSKAIGNVVGHTTFDINASEVAWDFLSRFQLPG